jgi:hypothetical protein
MKKTILSIALIFSIGIIGAFANDNDNVNKEVKTSFAREFSSAKNIQWMKTSSFNKATFNLNNQVMFAYYDPSGMLLAVQRNITSETLPINLQVDLKNNYSDHWISDLFETAGHGQTDYYVTLENADQKIILKSTNANLWSVYKKINKDSK